jgi:hypothetical protein
MIMAWLVAEGALPVCFLRIFALTAVGYEGREDSEQKENSRQKLSNTGHDY